MALTHILKKIAADAEKEAMEIANNNKQRIEEIQKNLDKQLKEAEASSAQETNQRQEAMDRKVGSHVQMEAKMGTVAIKTDLLNLVKKKAIAAIQSLPEGERIKMFEDLLKSISEEGTVHPAKGQEEILKKALNASGKSFQVGAAADIVDGFLFRGEKVDVDASFEMLLEKEVFPSIEAELSAILFEESKVHQVESS